MGHPDIAWASASSIQNIIIPIMPFQSWAHLQPLYIYINIFTYIYICFQVVSLKNRYLLNLSLCSYIALSIWLPLEPFQIHYLFLESSQMELYADCTEPWCFS